MRRSLLVVVALAWLAFAAVSVDASRARWIRVSTPAALEPQQLSQQPLADVQLQAAKASVPEF